MMFSLYFFASNLTIDILLWFSLYCNANLEQPWGLNAHADSSLIPDSVHSQQHVDAIKKRTNTDRGRTAPDVNPMVNLNTEVCTSGWGSDVDLFSFGLVGGASAIVFPFPLPSGGLFITAVKFSSCLLLLLLLATCEHMWPRDLPRRILRICSHGRFLGIDANNGRWLISYNGRCHNQKFSF